MCRCGYPKVGVKVLICDGQKYRMILAGACLGGSLGSVEVYSRDEVRCDVRRIELPVVQYCEA